MVYQATASTSFVDYFPNGNVNAQFTNETFVSAELAKNLRSASKVKLVIHDENNKVRQRLVFTGAYHSYDWFSKGKLESSSRWEESSLSSSMFSFSTDDPDSIFRIATDAASSCDGIGFLSMTCNNDDPVCEQMKWWSEKPDLKSRACGIAYSKQKNPVEYTKFAWASKIQILTKS